MFGREQIDKKILKITVLALSVWLLSMGLLAFKFYRQPLSPGPVSERIVEPIKAKDEWLGLYMNGQKIGFVHSSVEPDEDGYWITDRAYMQLQVMGSLKEITTFVQSKVNRDYSLNSFFFELKAGVVKFRVSGRIEDLDLLLTLFTGNKTSYHKIRLGGPVYLSNGISTLIKKARLEKGKSYKVVMFDPASLGQKSVKLVYEADDELMLEGRSVKAKRLKLDYAGSEFHVWVDKDGDRLKEEGPLGMVLVKEPKDKASKGVRFAGRSGDIIVTAAVKPVNRIYAPRGTRIVRLALEGVDLADFDLKGGRQTLSGNTVAIVVRDLPSKSPYLLPYNGYDLRNYLKSEPLIQSDAPEIKELAESVISGSRDPLVAARKLNRWVYENIEKIPTVSIPSALDVLVFRKGDCNEHTVLLTALARAVGIPARPVAGLIYMRNAFYYHAWVELYLGRWVAVDPVLGQFPADAAHLRLVTGGLERHTRLLGTIGKLKITILGSS